MPEDRKVTIRKATSKDVKAIYALELICFPEPWPESAIVDDVAVNPLSTYLVAEDEKGIRGYIGFWTVRGECQINNVAVAPEARNMHVGTLLLNAALDVTEEVGVEYWTLEVRVGNGAAIRLYEKAGFTVDGERKAYYGNGEDALLMSRRKEIA